MLQKLNARRLLQATTEELKRDLRGDFIVVFEDGEEVQTTDIQVVFSSFFWELLRNYPLTPITSKLFVVSVLGGKHMSSSTHTRFFERVVWAIHDHYESINQKVDMDKLGEWVFRYTNDVYNFGCIELEDEVMSTDYLDYVHLMVYPPLKAIRDGIVGTTESVDDAMNRSSEIVMKDPAIADNPLVVAARSGLVRLNQLLQCIVTRGFVTDLDNRIFAEPSLGNFAEGYKDFYSSFIDSRTSSVSLNSSANLLPTTEYGSRKLQILDMSVETIYDMDCGSQQYMNWLIRPDEHDAEGRVIRKGDFSNWLGKYFLDEDLGRVRELVPSDKHLIGKNLQFRSSISGCQHPDPHGLCMVCFSSQGKTVPEHTNIGHMVAAAMMQIIAQLILSTKHVANSSAASQVKLSDDFLKWIKPSSDGYGYVLAKQARGKRVEVIVNESSMRDIAVLNKTQNVEGLIPDHISEIEGLKIKITDPNNDDDRELIPVKVDHEKRLASFSTDALKFIKDNGYTRDDLGNYIFDFTTFPNNRAFLVLPKRMFNTADHAASITALIQGTGTDKKKRSQDGSLEKYFKEFYELVTPKISVSAVILETIIYGAAIRSAENEDYRPPRVGTPKQMGVTSWTVPGRSAGCAMAYERHARFIFSPALFTPNNLSSHLFDAFVMPQETVNDRIRRGLR